MKARIVTTILAMLAKTRQVQRLLLVMVQATLLGIMPAAAQSDRVVALVISVGDGVQRSDAIQAQLQLMGAETLRANEPSNAQLRSILMRFAREAANARATFVYLDVPAVSFEGRAFILPSKARLNRPTDLFTQAIPIQAFSRSAAQSEQGGAVALTVAPGPQPLLEGLSTVLRAPEAVPGASPVLVSGGDAFASILATFERAANSDEIEIGDMLRRMSVFDTVSVSDFPRNRIFLREPPQPRVEAEAVALPDEVVEPASDPAAENDGQESAGASGEEPSAAATSKPTESLEELELLEQSLSRAAKRKIQSELRQLDLYKGLVDGIFGPQTRDAITAFQTERSENATGLLTRRQLLDLSS